MKLLEVKHLKVWEVQTGNVIVHDTSFTLEQGQCLAIVGESGSGKSVTSRAIMRLNNKNLQQTGEIFLKNEALHLLSEKHIQRKRGKNLCMILQNGMTAFDPSCLIKVHLYETLHTHFGWSENESEQALMQVMEKVNLKNPQEILHKYPHQLSGGMLQRMMIALALALEPDIMIADEPTTALDTISQYEVVQQFINIRQQMNCAIIFISHDLGVVRKIADKVLVMKDGEVVEQGDVQAIFANPQHDYTKYLIATRGAINDHFKKVMGENVPC